MRKDILIGSGLLVVSGLAVWLLVGFHLALPQGSVWGIVPVEAKASAGIMSFILSIPAALFPAWLLVKWDDRRRKTKSV